MRSISDELCNWASHALRLWVLHARSGEHMDLHELDAIADRIDNETVELPRDRDGVPIHVGDTVYLDDGCKAEVTRIGIGMDEDSIYTILYGDDFSLTPGYVTHERPDSWERIADEFDEWRFEHMHYLVADDLNDLGLFADRIRKLAEREG